uniref:Uncharacterized protein n=1 Tax=Triticum urartu TaxID=4572 RepID=A0A8R7U8S7_TRIUA
MEEGHQWEGSVQPKIWLPKPEGEVDVHVLDLRHNIEVFLPAMVRSQGSGFLRRVMISYLKRTRMDYLI